ncbi:MAG: rRNA maturation RNase YbeY [Candidatus Nealsonbacteria bacterium]
MVEINNLTKEKISQLLLKRVAHEVLKKEKSKLKELSVVIVGAARMKQLNSKYRQKNKVTDVLSFKYDNSAEIVLCSKEIKANARKSNLTFKREIVKMLIHGLMHIMGYSHAGMMSKEKRYLDNF